MTQGCVSASAEKAIAHGDNAPFPFPRQLAVFYRHVLSGNQAEAVKTIENWGSPLQPQQRAGFYAILGDKELLENGLDEGYSSVMNVNTWPAFHSLRDDPRFTDLLRRMNLEP